MRIVVVGAGGQARETKALIEACHRVDRGHSFVGFVVSDVGKLGANDSRELVLGTVDWLRSHRSSFDGLAIGIANPSVRLAMGRQLLAEFGADVCPPLIHPSAVAEFHSWTIGSGSFVGAGVVGTVNITLQPFALLNFGATVGHEAVIGRGSVVNPGANISGGVRLGEGVMVGTGAQVLQYLQVGDNAVVGAGAVVVRDVPAGSTVVGVPARQLSGKGSVG